jgi:hypothetical protein
MNEVFIIRFRNSYKLFFAHNGFWIWLLLRRTCPWVSCWSTETSKCDCPKVVSSIFSVTSRALSSSAGPCRAEPPSPPPLPSPPHPTPRVAPYYALLGDALNDRSRNSTERCVLPRVRFRIYRRNWISFTASSRPVVLGQLSEVPGEFKWMINRRRYEWIRSIQKNTAGRPLKSLRVNRKPNFCVIFEVWDSYSLCVEIRCCETTSGDWES